MSMKVLEMRDYIHIVCIRNDGSVNPYRLYLFYPAKDRYGYPTEHRKKLGEYGDMHSIICHVHDMYKAGMQYKPYDIILAWNKEYYRPV